MALKPEASIMTGLATATVVYGVYQMSLPTVADTRALEVNAPDLSKAERTASWVSAGAVAGISLIARDPTVFIIGGATVIAMAWLHRHANFVNPLTKVAGTLTGAGTPDTSQADAPQNYAAPTAPEYDNGSF